MRNSEHRKPVKHYHISLAWTYHASGHLYTYTIITQLHIHIYTASLQFHCFVLHFIFIQDGHGKTRKWILIAYQPQAKATRDFSIIISEYIRTGNMLCWKVCTYYYYYYYYLVFNSLLMLLGVLRAYSVRDTSRCALCMRPVFMFLLSRTKKRCVACISTYLITNYCSTPSTNYCCTHYVKIA